MFDDDDDDAPPRKAAPAAPPVAASKKSMVATMFGDDSVDDSVGPLLKAAKPAGAKTDEELKAWDTEFTKVDQGTLFELILAANYLNIKPLLDLTCATVANMIKGKSPEEIRKTFNIENDFTQEEEEEVKRENQWAFE